MSSKWSYLAYSRDWTIITRPRCKHPCLLRAAAGAALRVQAATVRRCLAYPLSETRNIGALRRARFWSHGLTVTAQVQVCFTDLLFWWLVLWTAAYDVTHSNCVNSSSSFSLLMNQKLILMEGTKDCKYKHEKGSIRISERFLQLRTCLLYTDHCEISVKMISTEQVL